MMTGEIGETIEAQGCLLKANLKKFKGGVLLWTEL